MANLPNMNSVWKWKAKRGGQLPTKTIFPGDSDHTETTLVLSLIFTATTATTRKSKLLLGVGV